MPVFDAGKPLSTEPGWGCSCPAFRFGEPTPKQALAALARSANVTVEDLGAYRDSTHHFRAWTDPDNIYQVTFGIGRNGHCKHIIGCLVHWAPWFRQLALGASDALAEIKQLRKENKQLGRKIKRLEK